MKTIGVIGGIGPQATIDFEARLHAASQKLIPPRANSGYPPLLVYYHRAPPLVTGEDGALLIHPALLEKLEAFGALADFLVIPSNYTHILREAFEQVSGRKVLSMIDITVAEVRNRGWQLTGLLGMGEPKVYMEPFDRLGLSYETLSGDLVALRTRLDSSIIAVMEGQEGPADEAAAMEAVHTLRDKGVDGIVLGCTEIPLLMGEAADAPDLINPTALLAEAAVRYALQ